MSTIGILESDLAMLLITGASGFIGKALVRNNITAGFPVVGFGRDIQKLGLSYQDVDAPSNLHLATYSYDKDQLLDFESALKRANIGLSQDNSADRIVLIHSAGIAHRSDLSWQDYQRGIVEFSQSIFSGFAKFLKQTGRSGLIVNLSSIAARDPNESPREFLRRYGKAKAKSEEILTGLSRDSGTTISAVSIRPPAVWGPEAVGSFMKLDRFINSGLPLPIGSIRTKRAYLHIDSLSAAIARLVSHFENAPWQGHCSVELFDEQLEVSEIVLKLAEQKKVKANIVPFPPALLRTMLKGLKMHGLHDQLFSALDMDNSSFENIFHL